MLLSTFRFSYCGAPFSRLRWQSCLYKCLFSFQPIFPGTRAVQASTGCWPCWHGSPGRLQIHLSWELQLPEDISSSPDQETRPAGSATSFDSLPPCWTGVSDRREEAVQRAALCGPANSSSSSSASGQTLRHVCGASPKRVVRHQALGRILGGRM